MSELKQVIKEYNGLRGNNAVTFVDKRIALTNKMNDLYEPNAVSIGDVSNQYGGISVSKEGGCYFWALQDWSGDYIAEEITQELYEALIKFEEERK